MASAVAGDPPGAGAEVLPPALRGLPWLGNGPAFQRDQMGFLTRLHRRFGGAATIRLPGSRRLFFFAAPEAVAHVLVDNARNFTSREMNYPALSFLGDGLLNIDGERHRQERAVVQPAFGRQRVAAYAEGMLAEAERAMRGWRPGAVVDVHAEMRALTLRIAAEAFLHHDLGSETAAFTRAFHDVVRLGERRRPRRTGLALPFLPQARLARSERYLDGQVAALIEEHRRSGEDHGDVLSMLVHALDAAGGLPSDRAVRDHVVTVLAAGHETTANAMTFTLYLLARNPAARDRLQADLRREFGARPPAPDDLPRVPYLEMAVKEALRLYPPAWVIGRRALAPYETAGYRFAEGSFCIMSQWVTHRSPAYWTEPLRFWPERWLPPERGGQPTRPHAYFPFGGGPRTCIGMPFAMLEAQMVLAAVLLRFAPEPLPRQRLALEPVVTLRPAGGLRLRMRAVA